jgi:dipeptidyl aminopeptidase/acylaminoacyl peptidase
MFAVAPQQRREQMLKPVLYSFVLLLVLAPGVRSQEVQSVPVEFLSAGVHVRGKFFPARDAKPVYTLLLVPGWPGNPNDVLGLGQLLAEQGVNVLMFNPRGLHNSEGTASFPNTLEDIDAAIRWLGRPETQQRFLVDTARIALGGHSYGGGLATAYAAWNPSVRSVISIAGNDHGEFIRRYQRDSSFAAMMDAMLVSTRAPAGPVRFDHKANIRELVENEARYDLRRNANKLADRSILLLGGWEDQQTTIEQIMLPLYRALQNAGAKDVTFTVYHTNHNFSKVQERMANDIRDWLVRHQPH